MNHQIEVAREFMKLMREFRQPKPNEDGSYEGMLECDVHDLAKAAALLIETVGKTMPAFFEQGDPDVERLKVRISNLEAMNDNLRVNNAALREALEKMANPVRVVNNQTFIDATPTKSAAVPIADPGPGKYDREPTEEEQ